MVGPVLILVLEWTGGSRGFSGPQDELQESLAEKRLLALSLEELENC